MEEKYIKIAEAGKLIGLTSARLYQLIQENKLAVKYRRGVMWCKESDVLKLNEFVDSK